MVPGLYSLLLKFHTQFITFSHYSSYIYNSLRALYTVADVPHLTVVMPTIKDINQQVVQIKYHVPTGN